MMVVLAVSSTISERAIVQDCQAYGHVLKTASFQEMSRSI